MNIILSDRGKPLGDMLEAYNCPAILVSVDYQILAFNRNYETAFGNIDISRAPRCFAVSHGYDKPCDQSGEDCPLGAARRSGHKERVLHIHQTPRGKEHVDVEMLPIHNDAGELIYFVELLKPVPLASGAVADQELVGNSPVFNEMLGKIARVGEVEASVLLLGESGTGKELAARAIHMASKRKDMRLVTLECSGLSDTLFESELFGHVKGAFTGAHFNKKGLVELADGGTLFLDELGDIPHSMQVKLLRLLETGTYRPVGSVEVRSSSFRLVCATHKDLYQMVLDGNFRKDLYYRINVYPIHVPALRERTADIPIIAKSLLERLAPTKNFRLTASATRALSEYEFEGNIRELRNLLNRAIVITDTNIIDNHVIHKCIEEDSIIRDAVYQGVSHKAGNKKDQLWVDLKTNERNYLKQVLAAHRDDKEKTAKVLGISLRSLYRKMTTD
ncbi:MAG: sigma-54 dependent transcriptional regulator [Pseudohongiellaceae bacterium]